MCFNRYQLTKNKLILIFVFIDSMGPIYRFLRKKKKIVGALFCYDVIFKMADLPFAYERVYSIISPLAHVIHVFTHFLARESRIFHSIGDLTSNEQVIGHFNDNLDLASAAMPRFDSTPGNNACRMRQTDG